MLEYWKAVFDEAFPIRYMLGLAICVGILYFAGDWVHETYVDAADVVEEIVKPPEVEVVTETYVPEQVTNVVYKVGQDTARVMLH